MPETCGTFTPSPGCYGCNGTGVIDWGGVAPNVPCLCTEVCDNHLDLGAIPCRERDDEPEPRFVSHDDIILEHDRRGEHDA